MSLLLFGFILFAACSEEPRPRSVTEFLDNPIVLEAALVRCSQDRDETRYDAECVNARQAISVIEAREERARREALEERSEEKREALRQTQDAAEEERRRVAEEARLRRDAEYLAQFGELPPSTEADAAAENSTGNAPAVIIPEPVFNDQELSAVPDSPPASDGGNAPVSEVEPASDLDAVREELQQRNEESGAQEQER
jgi:hypothetical protein